MDPEPMNLSNPKILSEKKKILGEVRFIVCQIKTYLLDSHTLATKIQSSLEV